MNPIPLQIKRRLWTAWQVVATPYHRMCGRTIVHLIHPAKTGGTSVKIALMSFGCKTKTHYFCLHGHAFRLKDVPDGDLAIITIRNKYDRNKSVLAARKWKAWNYGPLHKWLIGMTKEEEDNLRYGKTSAVHSLLWYREYALHVPTYTLSTETLTMDFEALKPIFGIPAWVQCGHANKSPKA